MDFVQANTAEDTILLADGRVRPYRYDLFTGPVGGISAIFKKNKVSKPCPAVRKGPFCSRKIRHFVTAGK